ncbi:MAG: hypothetical protein EOO50_09780 [Flavobacterium sp.]|uniref:hypothetical protein n=1 Tax=Flavobacterium sp. TaxID=239 RepID=UPI0011F409E9|nr:hypothetical protein [Flavobacterium sp.]RZJ66504.1 MAG: hypothetical protein EOO50_09780 [Flavobacterium sp.]
MIEIARNPNDYILYRRLDRELVLIVQDSAGIFEFEYILNSGEKYSFESHGDQMLGLLAQRVRDEEARF